MNDGADFIVVELEAQYCWNPKTQDYEWTGDRQRVDVEKALNRHYYSSLKGCLEYIRFRWWQKLKDGDEDNIVDTFDELLAVATRLDERMKLIHEDAALNSVCERCRNPMKNDKTWH